MRFHKQHLQVAVKLINDYDGSLPFTHYLKNYYSNNKKHGSKDRKSISHFCYSYYRLGKSLPNVSIEEAIVVALFLCTPHQEELVNILQDEWLLLVEKPLQQKISFIQNLYPAFSLFNIFSWMNELSGGIDESEFSISHLIQPNLFLRIRPQKEKIVKDKLYKADIEFMQFGTNCLAFANATKVEAILKLNYEVVVQDYSSQQVQQLLQTIAKTSQQKRYSIWDCCAASGGKSILAKDVLQNVQLTVSDVRYSILENLKRRLSDAAINLNHLFVADLSKPITKVEDQQFDIIMADVPCTGSGTWSRTPEQLCYFSSKTIEEFSMLQKKIVENVIPFIKTGGYFLYITCSVFKKENEEQVEFIEKLGLKLIEQKVLKGYSLKADTMFAALFLKSNS